VPAGSAPEGVAASPDGSSLYVTNNGDSTLSQYTIGANGQLSPKQPATVPAGASPVDVAVVVAPVAAGKPTHEAQCKHGGWQKYKFTNQGRCIAYVKHRR